MPHKPWLLGVKLIAAYVLFLGTKFECYLKGFLNSYGNMFLSGLNSSANQCTTNYFSFHKSKIHRQVDSEPLARYLFYDTCWVIQWWIIMVHGVLRKAFCRHHSSATKGAWVHVCQVWGCSAVHLKGFCLACACVSLWFSAMTVRVQAHGGEFFVCQRLV